MKTFIIKTNSFHNYIRQVFFNLVPDYSMYFHIFGFKSGFMGLIVFKKLWKKMY